MKITGNESVSRVIDKEDNGYGVMLTHIDSNGLTIRQYFAVKAMAGLLSDSGIQLNEISSIAVQQADALIKELNETPNPNE